MFGKVIIPLHFVGITLITIYFTDIESHGIFANRALGGPNSINLPAVCFVKIEDTKLYVWNIDIPGGSLVWILGKTFLKALFLLHLKMVGWIKLITRLKNKKILSVLKHNVYEYK